jgi:hypothetical protein
MNIKLAFEVNCPGICIDLGILNSAFNCTVCVVLNNRIKGKAVTIIKGSIPAFTGGAEERV